jgi:hypothetical protein
MKFWYRPITAACVVRDVILDLSIEGQGLSVGGHRRDAAMRHHSRHGTGVNETVSRAYCWPKQSKSRCPPELPAVLKLSTRTVERAKVVSRRVSSFPVPDFPSGNRLGVGK